MERFGASPRSKKRKGMCVLGCGIMSKDIVLSMFVRECVLPKQK